MRSYVPEGHIIGKGTLKEGTLRSVGTFCAIRQTPWNRRHIVLLTSNLS
jgi:hypothetical protein